LSGKADCLASPGQAAYRWDMPLAAREESLISVDDYLAGEEASEIKHEYVGGVIYAMAGVTKAHNRIALNIYTACRARLRGGPCTAFASDLKVRLKFMGDDVFYYPDVVVGCDPRDTDDHFLRYPKFIAEVLSDSTERLDRREKRWGYQAIETLEEYLIVAQDRIEVTLFRRANGWEPQVLARLGQKVQLKSLKLSLLVSDIYEGVALARKG